MNLIALLQPLSLIKHLKIHLQAELGSNWLHVIWIT